MASGSLTDETRLVLLNALHFQGLWKVPFDPKLTQERLFHCANGSAVPVHMMRLTSRFTYGGCMFLFNSSKYAPQNNTSICFLSLSGEFVTADGLDYDVIEVPYQGDSLSMLLVSPIEPEVPLSMLTADLSSKRIEQWRAGLRSVKRQLAMPR